MTKLNINIKVNEIEEIAPVVEYVKKLELNKILEYNPVVTVELVVVNVMINFIIYKLVKITEKISLLP